MFLSFGIVGIFLIATFAVIYWIFFSIIIKKPEYSLYAFIIVTLFFPRGYYYASNPIIVNRDYGVFPFLIVQIISVFPIIIQLIRHGISNSQISIKLRRFRFYISIAVISLFVFELIRNFVGSFWGELVYESSLLYGVNLFSAVIFLYGSISFIKKVEHIKKIFIIILFGGIELVLETILYGFLRLPFLPRVENVISGPMEMEGRFFGLIFGSNLLLVIVCFAAIGVSLYFIFSSRRYIFLVLVPMLYLPAIMTYERAPIFAGLLVPFIFFLFVTKSKKIRIAIFISAISFIFLYNNVVEIVTSHNLFSINKNRPYYFSGDNLFGSWMQRIGNSFRGIDLFVFSFPIGIGVGDQRFYEMVSSPKVPALFTSLSHYEFAFNESYWKLLSGMHQTDPHNLYIKFITEYGLFGVISLIIFISSFFSRLLLFLKSKKILIEEHKHLFLIQASSIAVLFGMGAYFFFQAFTLYPLLFFFFYIMFFQPKSSRDCRSPLTKVLK
jgi:hypothetical protein